MKLQKSREGKAFLLNIWLPRIFIYSLVPLALIIWYGCGDSGIETGGILDSTSRSLSWEPASDREAFDLSGTFQTADGSSIDMSESGQNPPVLFLNFWATWCGPCLAEMPYISELHEQLSDEGLKVVAITNEPLETVSNYLASSELPFTILLDSEDALAGRYKVLGLPTTFVIDRSGKLALKHLGPYRWDDPQIIEEFRDLLVQ